MKKVHSRHERTYHENVDPVATRLHRICDSEESLDLAPFVSRPRDFPVRTELLSKGQGLAAVTALVTGWAGHVEMLADGRRQIIHLVLPGEIIGYPRPGRQLSTSTVVALSAVKVCSWRVSNEPRLAAAQLSALCSSDAIEHSCMANQISRIGRRSAYERVAHLLLEIRDRLALAGVASGDRFPMPLTQETMADVLGITTVHVNRTLQQLRAEHQVDLRSGMVELGNPERLMQIADYSPLIFTRSLH